MSCQHVNKTEIQGFGEKQQYVCDDCGELVDEPIEEPEEETGASLDDVAGILLQIRDMLAAMALKTGLLDDEQIKSILMPGEPV